MSDSEGMDAEDDAADDFVMPPALPEVGETNEEDPEADTAAEDAEGLMELIMSAKNIEDDTERDMALLSALRKCRNELEAAEIESKRTTKWLADAKEVFDFANRLLVGGRPLEDEILDEKKNLASTSKIGKRLSYELNQSRKRTKTTDTSENDNSTAEEKDLVLPVPKNPITLPGHHTSGGGMSSDILESHRDVFYRKLFDVPASEIEDFTPSSSSANLKSKAQLAEAVHIVRHWSTGADGLDTTQFRAKHKTWYTRLRPATEKLGRRTGIHLRTLDSDETALCRFSKDGTKSTVYLPLEQIYDAIFEVHALETDHRPRDVVKSRLDDKYANIPDAQVKAFIETCPVCLARRDKS